MTSLIWFRNNLRVNDNLSLLKACEHEKTIAVYVFDPIMYDFNAFGFKKTERYRAKFLIESINDLRKNLEGLNITLLVYTDHPANCIPDVIKEHQISTVYLQREWTRDETKTLTDVKANCASHISFVETYDQFLYHPCDIPFTNFENIPTVFTQFRKRCEKESSIRNLSASIQKKPKVNRIATITNIPTLKQLGLQEFEMDVRTAFPFSGGEDAANARLHSYLWETKKVAIYKKTRNGLIGVDYSTKLSPWLANGCISAKTIFWQIKEFEKKEIKNQDTYWVVFELIWRDFFKYISLKHGSAIFKIGGILNKSYEWKNDVATMHKWTNGKTSEPFVNANMKELLTTGWMSNRGRQNVASFWSKHLEQDWRIGAAYFECMLIDYDVHSNWCNWMYNSGVGNDPRNRTFNIKRQADMYDAKKKYQKLWLQERLF